MALSNEDKKDVSRAMGKALANKVSKATRDSKHFMGGNSIKNGKKVWDSINKTGKYESPAAKKAMKASHERQESYAKERAERYKREGLSD